MLIIMLIVVIITLILDHIFLRMEYKKTKEYKRFVEVAGEHLNSIQRNEWENFLILEMSQSVIDAVPDGYDLKDFIREEHNKSLSQYIESMYKDLLTVIPDEDRKEFVEAYEREK